MPKTPNPPPKENTWAFQPIGAPFPDCPVKVTGEQNQYVALWYKNGKPVHGRGWNNGGVVECSFPYVIGAQKSELTGAKDLGGQIQILTYNGDHNSLGYWYEWIKYSERFDKSEERQMVKCGDSLPIIWKTPTGNICGYLDNKTEKAYFSQDKNVTVFEGGALANMMIVVRNIKGGPAFCECSNCYVPPPPPPPGPPPPPPPGPPPPKIMLNEWMDAKVGDKWPSRALVKALDKTLDNTLPGANPDKYVALWYMGEPVMGRVWNEGGKIAACFSWNGREFTGNVGSIQLLIQLSDHVRGFDYTWVPWKMAVVFGDSLKTFTYLPSVYVDNLKVAISPCVVNLGGKQILGKADIRNEKASSGHGGKDNELVGPACYSSMVLVRRARKGYFFDG